MRYFMVFAFFLCLVFPVFAQDANDQRYQSLSDSMGNTADNSKTKLENYDDELKNSGSNNSYASYREKYVSLQRRLRVSEERLDLLIRTKDKTSYIKEERDKYEGIINELDKVKSDYDSWMKSNK